MVKKWLDDKDIRFQEINLDDQPEYITEVKEMGFMSAPIIKKDNIAFSGFRPGELAKLA